MQNLINPFLAHNLLKEPLQAYRDDFALVPQERLIEIITTLKNAGFEFLFDIYGRLHHSAASISWPLKADLPFSPCLEIRYWLGRKNDHIYLCFLSDQSPLPSITSFYHNALELEQSFTHQHHQIFEGQNAVHKEEMHSTTFNDTLFPTLMGKYSSVFNPKNRLFIHKDSFNGVLHFVGPHESKLPDSLQLRLYLQGSFISHADARLIKDDTQLEKYFEREFFNTAALQQEKVSSANLINWHINYALALEKALKLSPADDFRNWWLMIILESCRIFEHIQVFAQLSALMPAKYRQSLKKVQQLCVELIQLVVPAQKLVAPLRLDASLMQQKILEVEKKLQELLSTFPQAQLSKRCAHKGKMDHKELIAHGISGPTLKATGYFYDLRAQKAYLNYAQLKISPSHSKSGDALARYFFRLQESHSSAQLIRHMLQLLPAINLTSEYLLFPELQEKFFGRKEERPLAADSSYCIEGPEGVQAVHIHFGEQSTKAHFTVRSPHYALAHAFADFISGNYYEDILPILYSLGLDYQQIGRL